MADNSSGHEAPTRRECVRYGGAVVGGTLLAGCAGHAESGSRPTETSTDTPTGAETTTEEQVCSARIEPTGRVEFDESAESVVPALQFGADLQSPLASGTMVGGWASGRTSTGHASRWFPGTHSIATLRL